MSSLSCTIVVPCLPTAAPLRGQPYHFGGLSDREALDDLETVARDPHDAARVVGQEADALHAEVRQHLRAQAEVSQARLAGRRHRGLAGLREDGAELVEHARAAAREDIEQHALP